MIPLLSIQQIVSGGANYAALESSFSAATHTGGFARTADGKFWVSNGSAWIEVTQGNTYKVLDRPHGGNQSNNGIKITTAIPHASDGDYLIYGRYKTKEGYVSANFEINVICEGGVLYSQARLNYNRELTVNGGVPEQLDIYCYTSGGFVCFDITSRDMVGGYAGQLEVWCWTSGENGGTAGAEYMVGWTATDSTYSGGTSLVATKFVGGVEVERGPIYGVLAPVNGGTNVSELESNYPAADNDYRIAVAGGKLWFSNGTNWLPLFFSDRATAGTGTWTTANWTKAIELQESRLVRWPKGTGDYSFGIAKEGNIVYLIKSESDDNDQAMISVVTIDFSLDKVAMAAYLEARRLIAWQDGENIISAGGTHCYLAFYPATIDAARGGWVGFGSGSDKTLTIQNERDSDAHINLIPGTGGTLQYAGDEIATLDDLTAYGRTFTSASIPTTGDDSSLGYRVGDKWIVTGDDGVSSGFVFECTDDSVGAAIWFPPQRYPIPPAELPSSINATKIANGTVSNTEFQALNGLTGNIQGQIDDHLADTTDAHDASAISYDATGNTVLTGDDVQEVLDQADAALAAGDPLTMFAAHKAYKARANAAVDLSPYATTDYVTGRFGGTRNFSFNLASAATNSAFKVHTEIPVTASGHYLFDIYVISDDYSGAQYSMGSRCVFQLVGSDVAGFIVMALPCSFASPGLAVFNTSGKLSIAVDSGPLFSNLRIHVMVYSPDVSDEDYFTGWSVVDAAIYGGGELAIAGSVTSFNVIHTNELNNQGVQIDASGASTGDVMTYNGTKWEAAVPSVAFSGVYAYKTADQGSIGTGYTKITFDAERFDTGNNFASSTFTAPTTQKYLFEACVTVGNDTAGNLLALVYYVNGSRVTTTRRESGLTTSFPRIFQMVNPQELSLTAGDTVDLYVYSPANTTTVYGVGVGSDTGLTSIRIKPLGV